MLFKQLLKNIFYNIFLYKTMSESFNVLYFFYLCVFFCS